MAVIRGTDGSDRLVGTSADDELFGYFGNDVLFGGRGGDELNGGIGIDTASYRTAARRVVADLIDDDANLGAAAGDLFDSVERLIGTRFNDELRGGVGNTVLFGGAGNDTLIGQSGTTVLVGGAGADKLVGLGVTTVASYTQASGAVIVDLQGAARNTGEAAGDVFDNILGIQGSRFSDSLLGDRRENLLVGFAGTDRLSGRGGNDSLDGGAGADVLFGGAGTDVAVYASAAVAVKVDLALSANNRGGARGDRYASIEGIEGSAFGDILAGNGADNRLFGGEGGDRLFGRTGEDFLSGLADDDALFGGAARDTMIGGLGADAHFGGAGFDIAAYWSAAGGLTVDLQFAARNTGEARGDGFTGVEGVGGSSFSDSLRGDTNANRLFGRDGGDRLDGRGGADTLFGEGGDDDLRGAAGNDQLLGGSGADRLFGGFGSDSASYLFAASGLTVDLGNAAANTGEAVGDQYDDIENIIGSAFSDILRGDAAANSLSGQGGDDVIEGGAGNDSLLGQSGGDVLFGGAGRDALVGGAGRDVLTGGALADRFVFNAAPAIADYDDIVDFTPGQDRFELGRFFFGTLPAGELSEDRFVIGAAAADANDRIIYNAANGSVSYDADGAGGAAAVRFALISENLDIAASDFFLV